jgi:hypothetical protein
MAEIIIIAGGCQERMDEVLRGRLFVSLLADKKAVFAQRRGSHLPLAPTDPLHIFSGQSSRGDDGMISG